MTASSHPPTPAEIVPLLKQCWHALNKHLYPLYTDRRKARVFRGEAETVRLLLEELRGLHWQLEQQFPPKSKA